MHPLYTPRTPPVHTERPNAEDQRPDHDCRLGNDGELHPRLRPRRAEREQGVHGGGTALRGRAEPEPARPGETASETAGRTTLDERGRGGDLRAGDAEPGPQPGNRAGTAGGADRAGNGGAQKTPPDPAHQGQHRAAPQGQEGAGGGEAVEGGDGGVKQ